MLVYLRDEKFGANLDKKLTVVEERGTNKH